MLHPTYLPFARKQLRQRRWQLGLTCKELAALAGLSGTAISCLEGGKCRPREKTAKALGEALEKAKASQDAAPSPGPETIRPRRVRLGMSQSKLADEACVDRH